MPIKINGSTSGSVTLNAPATGSDVSLTLPTLGFGKILQVVQNTYSVETYNTTTSYVDTGLSCNITPNATSSKILVLVAQGIYTQVQANTDQGCALRILRNGSAVFTHGRAMVLRAGTGNATFVLNEQIVSLTYLDSPSSTSALTYKVQMAGLSTGPSQQVVAQLTGAPSTLTLIEVAA